MRFLPAVVPACLAALACCIVPGAVRPLPAFAQAAPVPLEAEYEIYARGLNVAELQAAFALGEANYRVQVAYHTTGLVGFLFRGHQVSVAEGIWRADEPEPRRFSGDGVWRGQPRTTLIEYDHGQPAIRSLVPPNEVERDPVPPASQTNTVDSLSALALLIRHVQETGQCDVRVVTFDGRRLAEVAAQTAGNETLPTSGRRAYSGPTLRCDFEGRQLGGFLHDADRAQLQRPQHGSAWFARLQPGGQRVPVQITFETRWFGDATMYLAKAGPGVTGPEATGGGATGGGS